MDIGSLLLVACFIWAVWLTIRKPSRGNIWVMTAMGILLGVDAGFTIAWRLYIPELRSVLGNAYNSIENDQLYASMISAATLVKLDDGKNSEAKSLLATQVASYYRQLKNANTLTAQQKKTLAHLEELRSKSETLRQKLAEPMEKQP